VSSVCDNPASALSLEQAVQRLIAGVMPIRGDEVVPLNQALGRVLALEVTAPLDLPRFTHSAMDGYALRASEALPAARLRVSGTALAGRPFGGCLGKGECVRIFTGAALPEGAEAVVMQEQTERQGDTVTLTLKAPLRAGANVRYRGEELSAGDPLLTAGILLQPADIGLLAVAGCSDVTVRRRLRVALMATGDELAEPGQPLPPGWIHESNRPVLHALLTELGMEPLDLGVVRDDRAVLQQALRAAAEQADALITTGGASVGEADYVVDLLRESGQVEFWKVAIKPGKPFVFGRLGATPVLGLPGNPVSMMITFLQLARPALQRMAGMQPSRPLRWRVTCLSPIRKSPGRLEFQRGVLDWQDGKPGVTPLREQGSHRLTSMSRADCLIVLPAGCAGVTAGESVEIELLHNGMALPAKTRVSPLEPGPPGQTGRQPAADLLG
jgi:molybdopterin molybdotransferase